MNYYCTIALLWLNSLLFAKLDLRNGFIIANSNDTIYGLIDYKSNSANALKCHFKADSNSVDQVFAPKDIKGYRFINSKYYVSKIIDEDQREKHLFLEYLINGIIDVYYYRNDKGDHYFIQDANNQLSELKNEEKELFEDNKRYVKDSREYIGLLKYTFRESPPISKKAEYIDLNHKYLIKISEGYHKEVCADEECIIYEEKLPKRKSTFGIMAGLNGIFISQVRDLPEDLYFLKESEFGLTVFPSIGFYYKQRMPFINERLYFQYEGTYAHLKLNTNHSFIEPVYKMNYLNEVSYTQNMIHNLGYLKYEFPRGKLRPTFQFGGFANCFFNNDYHRDLEVLFSWGDTFLEAETEDNPFLKMNYGVNM